MKKNKSARLPQEGSLNRRRSAENNRRWRMGHGRSDCQDTHPMSCCPRRRAPGRRGTTASSIDRGHHLMPGRSSRCCCPRGRRPLDTFRRSWHCLQRRVPRTRNTISSSAGRCPRRPTGRSCRCPPHHGIGPADRPRSSSDRRRTILGTFDTIASCSARRGPSAPSDCNRRRRRRRARVGSIESC